jgi:hypothetical protein
MDHSCVDGYIQQLWSAKRIDEMQVKKLCMRAREILVDEPNVVHVSAPVSQSAALTWPRVVCGSGTC